MLTTISRSVLIVAWWFFIFNGQVAPENAGPFEDREFCRGLSALEYAGPVGVSACFQEPEEQTAREKGSTAADLPRGSDAVASYSDGNPMFFVAVPPHVFLPPTPPRQDDVGPY